MVVPQGFEPQISGPKPDVLPLHQRTIYVGAIGLEPMNSNEGGFTVRSNCRYATLPNKENRRWFSGHLFLRLALL